MTTIKVEHETETGHGWRYEVTVERAGLTTLHTVGLSWADHEWYSGGRLAPSQVVESIVRALVERESAQPLPRTFDCATARRWFPDLDQALAPRMRRTE